MSGINADFVEKIKYTSDIVDLISDYIDLKKMGNNYKGLCPFHQEKTPSFNVSAEKQLYHCFGCGAGGDIISFLMEIENVSFYEALKILAERNGISLPTNDNQYNQRKREEKELVFTINSLAARFFHYVLLNTRAGKGAYDYLENRGFDKKDCKEYYLGYAPNRWSTLYDFLRKKNYNDKILIKAGLISAGKNNSCYDRFRGRIIFPIFNIRSEVIAFGGRIIDENAKAPKYLNSPDTPVFKKRENLYGLNWAKEAIRRNDEVVIMEGYTDVLTARKYGIENIVASLGTAFTEKQASLIRRYANNVYISYDSDVAGNKATLRGLDILTKEGLNVRVISLPENTDPDEYIKKEGIEGFNNLKEKALNLIEFKIESLKGEYDIDKIDEKVSFTREIIKVLSSIKDQVKQDIHIQNIARKYEINIQTIKKGISTYANAKDSKKKDKNYNKRYTKKDNESQKGSINNIEEDLLKFYMLNPEMREEIDKYILTDFFPERYHGLIDLIKKNQEFSINDILDNIDEDKEKKLVLSLALSDENGENNLNNLLDKFIRKIKGNIYLKLQYDDIEKARLEELNKLLLKFINLSN
ncbi:MAG: DNA primase [Halanaerobiales bacterium]